MKAVLMSIQPKWCELIASGEKPIEVRKTKPKLETPFKVYIYCTKGRGDCLWRWGGIWYDTQFPNERPNRLDGKVIGEFVCDRIHEFTKAFFDEQEPQDTDEISFFLDQFCLTYSELCAYVGLKDFYGWSISNLVIYEKPRELREFITPTECKSGVAKSMMCNTCCLSADFCSKKPKRITRPPQSWCYVEEL